MPRLEAMGYDVLAPDLPGHGWALAAPGGITLQSYIDALAPILAAAREPMTVVAHSRGGIVLSALTELMTEKISSAIYLAAVLLRDGETVFDIAHHADDSLLLPNIFAAEDRSWDMLREDAFDEVLYADCSAEDRALCHLLLTPEPLAPSLMPMSVSAERFGATYKVYVELTEDRAVTLGDTKFLLSRATSGASSKLRVARVERSGTRELPRLTGRSRVPRCCIRATPGDAGI